MNRMQDAGLKTPSCAALALAFASLGDAFLYPFLPVNYAMAGVPVAWVGVLLSINRIVRIVSNGLMARLISRYGLRMVMILASALAVLSTSGYAFASGIVAWMILRIFWGLSFSALRIGTIAYALKQPNTGLALGVSRSLQELGPAISLLLAPALLKYFDTTIVFILLTLFSIPALYFAFSLTKTNDKTSSTDAIRILRFPSIINGITFVSATIIDGLLIVTLGVLFLHNQKNITLIEATTLAAFYLGYRRFCLVVLSSIAGWIADKIGLDKMFTFSLAMLIIGLLMIAFGWTVTGIVIGFTFYSLHSVITPGTVSRTDSQDLFTVSENATWRDMGAAAGTLLGGILMTSSYLTSFLLFLTFVLVALLLVHLRTARKTLKYLYLWK